MTCSQRIKSLKAPNESLNMDKPENDLFDIAKRRRTPGSDHADGKDLLTLPNGQAWHEADAADSRGRR